MLVLRASLHGKVEITVLRSHADSERPTEEVQSVEAEVELQDLSTSAQVQTDTEATEATEAHTTPKPVNPTVELALIRRTSVDKVRLVRGKRLGLYIYLLQLGLLDQRQQLCIIFGLA